MTVAPTGSRTRGGPLKELSELISESAQRFSAPGLGIAIVDGDDELMETFGVTSVENPLPVDADTLFRIASVTKPATGTALMKLIEMGRLDLDAPLRTYLPDLRLADEEAAAGVTMRHVVSHRVGLFGPGADFGPGDDALARWAAQLHTLPQRARLGELWCYSVDFRFAGRVIEVVTGKTYEAAMRELVLEPLGMTSSCFSAAGAITHRVALGHQVTDGTARVIRPWFESRAGSSTGGMLSTLKDLTRFMRLHLGTGPSEARDRVLSPESVAFMASALNPDGVHGLGWWRHRLQGIETVQHAGGVPGYLADLLLVPARTFGLMLLANITRPGVQARLPEVETLVGKIQEWALDHFLGIRVPADAPLALPDADLAPYVGRYVGGHEWSDVEIAIHDGGLIARELPKTDRPDTPRVTYRLAFYDRDSFFRLDGDWRSQRGQFVRDGSGRVTWFRPAVNQIYRRSD